MKVPSICFPSAHVGYRACGSRCRTIMKRFQHLLCSRVDAISVDKPATNLPLSLFSQTRFAELYCKCSSCVRVCCLAKSLVDWSGLQDLDLFGGHRSDKVIKVCYSRLHHQSEQLRAQDGPSRLGTRIMMLSCARTCIAKGLLRIGLGEDRPGSTLGAFYPNTLPPLDKISSLLMIQFFTVGRSTGIC